MYVEMVLQRVGCPRRCSISFVHINEQGLPFLAQCSPTLVSFAHTQLPLPAWTLTIQDSLELPRGGGGGGEDKNYP